MLVKTAERFAQASLELYGGAESFITGVEEEDQEIVAQAFERAGCLVLREPLRRRIKVTPLPNGSAAPRDSERRRRDSTL